MSPEVSAVFESLTRKQHEALTLASSHLTSKQIALTVGVAPVTIDKRIEAVRARLGHISRMDLLRLYRQWCAANLILDTYEETIGDPTILGASNSTLPMAEPQPAERELAFEDSIILDARAVWDRNPGWLRPGLKPSDLGVSGKLVMILAGAVATMMVAVLSVAFIDALMSILER